ncbi:hypothetical protein ACH5RR_031879 [Cinchona calisaya]|uniref:glucan endo-1,3-beta-D-glucosidase n=1 Tax=Cinchona calisaya TaxID=153742 RepID=A0ABD2YJH9_9GENT
MCGNNLPSIYHTIQLLQSMNCEIIKLQDANHDALQLLSGTNLRVSITIANDIIADIASNQTTADQWVRENVLAYYPGTMIRFILVGQEVLSHNDTTLWYNLVPAMTRIHDSVRANKIQNIKIGTPLDMNILESTFPPSTGKFRPDIPHDQVMIPLLNFLTRTSSYFFVNVFPYYTWSENPTNVSLNLALFRGDQNSSYTDPESGLIYTNLLDQMLDSVLFATRKLGFDHISLAISETGWPSAGDIDQPGANIYNAATYNRNLVRKMTTKPPIGTPARPGMLIPTFIHSLFDENWKPGRATERHFGILQPNGWPLYELDLIGTRGDGNYPDLPMPLNNEPFEGNLWCVVASGVNLSELGLALNFICSHGNGICDALAPRQECYEPVSIIAHASYAFSSYWAKFRSQGTACYFNGLAMQTTRDPNAISSKIGVNYGLNGNNLPSVYQSIELLQKLNAGRVKIFDTNTEVLKLLSGTKLQVSIMVPNQILPDIASDQEIADKWVLENVLAYYPNTMIRYILVGNEILSSNDTMLCYNLVPAMLKIHNSIKAQNIQNIKIGTPLAMDILESTFPPSSGKFRPEIPTYQVMVPLLNFLNRTRSFFFLNVYPYFAWSENPKNVNLDFALFAAKTSSSYKDPGSGLIYTNLLDQMLDSVIFAIRKVGFNNISLAISETGWPNAGDIDQPGANIHNAATYNRNLVRKITSKPPIGTPARPGVVIPTFIFSLYDEHQKSGPGTERHWGILQPNGQPNYALDLSGLSSARFYTPLPEPTNNKRFRGKLWCVVDAGVNFIELGPILDLTCKEGNGICDALAPGKDCYEPVSGIAHASYAFSSYWAKYRNSNGSTCYFNGFATQTTRDPSK